MSPSKSDLFFLDSELMDNEVARKPNSVSYLILLSLPSVLKMDTRLKLVSRDYNRLFENVMKYVSAARVSGSGNSRVFTTEE